VGDKWTLLIVRDLAAGPRRFIELQRVLPGISTEQLRSRLNRMVADGLLTRKRYREVPPRVDYELTERARDLMPVLGALARWGYEWAWSAPRASEDITLGAIFRLASGNIRIAGGGGTVEVIVEDGETPSYYTFTISPAGTEIAEREAERPDVRIAGNEAAWIEALAPSRNRAGLRITGNEGLALGLLDGLSGGGAAGGEIAASSQVA
jgi:DNA-binding HxlR family transcriptional regulator